jgi:hypothetical protein
VIAPHKPQQVKSPPKPPPVPKKQPDSSSDDSSSEEAPTGNKCEFIFSFSILTLSGPQVQKNFHSQIMKGFQIPAEPLSELFCSKILVQQGHKVKNISETVSLYYHPVYFLCSFDGPIAFFGGIISHMHHPEYLQKAHSRHYITNKCYLCYPLVRPIAFISGNGIRPIFIIRPKNAFISGTDTSDSYQALFHNRYSVENKGAIRPLLGHQV